MQRMLFLVAWLVGWGWALIAGVGGFLLLLHQGPLPITNGWFAMFSGIAACPLTAVLLKRLAGVPVPHFVQFGIALLIFVAGRAAVAFLLHRPFLPIGTMAIAVAGTLLTVCLAVAERHDTYPRKTPSSQEAKPHDS